MNTVFQTPKIKYSIIAIIIISSSILVVVV